MNLRPLTLVALLALVILRLPSHGHTAPIALIQDVVFTAAEFADGSGQGYAITADGLSMDDMDVTAFYVSPAIEAPFPYNAVVPAWIAGVPETVEMEILLRTAKNAGEWTEWLDIHAHGDWTLPDEEEAVGDMVSVPAADVTHNYVQFMIQFNRSLTLSTPWLRQLTLTFIDSTDGPTVEQMMAQQAALDAASPAATETTTAYPRPQVVRRQTWCIYAACNYSGMSYHPVSHLIVHHTVSSNSSSDWAAVVRAIWNYHTFSRQWGDIGYNYLVDMNGVIYEGHNNADYLNLDVVGTHSGDANTGGLGVALIGTFTTAAEYSQPGMVPPQAMLHATADLLAWKASQRSIDVYNASRPPRMRWGLPHLMGHRDVYGGLNTLCPGGEAHTLLPWLRDQVAARIGFASPYIYVDELSSAFSRSNANWQVAQRGCGNNGHAYYTWSTTNAAQSTNWGEWRPQLPQNGRYRIEVYAPYCNTGRAETTGARYQVHHAGGVSTVVVNQDANVGLWMSLGEFDLLAGNHTVIRLSDLTTTDSGRGVWFDAVRLRPLSALPPLAVENQQPVAGAWLNQRNVTFNWSVNHPAAVANATLQVATDAAFTDVILSQAVGGGATSVTHTFGQDFANWYWRVVLTHVQGGVTASVPTPFNVDTIPPTSLVYAMYRLPDGRLIPVWSGEDALSGVASYNIDQRIEGVFAWTPWLTNTTATAHVFVPPDLNQIYWFRSQAVDRAGNVEPPHGPSDINSTQAILLPHAIMLPMITRP